jgi:D-glycero-alpha-D-manno-heptose-7-phosphate kinase
MSFVGGGSDLPTFYREYGGAVVSTAINRYVYVNVNKKFDNGIRVSYSRTEEVSAVEEVEHPLVRASLEFLDIRGGIEITTIADIPSRGSGLGSSSSFTVGLLNALNAFKGRHVSREQLGEDSCHIELERCRQPIGKQDQYAAAFGGLNFIEFNRNDSVVVSPIICNRNTTRTLEKNLLVLYTGTTRSASSVLKRQSEHVEVSQQARNTLRRMVDLAFLMRDELHRDCTASIGEMLHEGWMLKKTIDAGISSTSIDDWYAKARKAGALGGKILGAGAGGFLLFYAEKERHEAIKEALPMLRSIDIAFEPLGSRIIFYE